MDRPDALEPRAGHGQQMVVHPQEMLADDVQAAMRHQMMDVRDPPRDRVVDRDHRPLGPALAHRSERFLEGFRRQGLEMRADLTAGEMRVGAGLALEDDPPGTVDRRIAREAVCAGRLIHRSRLGC